MDISRALPLRYLLPLIIFIEGFVSIAVEILTIRQLLPVAGGSVIVTSLIIGFFLLFLAGGYQRGGRLCTQLRQSLQVNFLISAVWLGVGLSYAFITLFFYAVQRITGPHIVYPLIAYLLFVIAPLSYLLCQTIPITMNMVKQDALACKIGGETLGLSTVGAFLGATLTTLVLMSFLGVAWTIIINVFLLLLLVFFLADSAKAFLLLLCIMLVVISLIYPLNILIERHFFILTNHYANYQISNQNNSPLKNDEQILFINEAPSSFVNKDKQGFAYIERIKKILFHELKLRDKSILVLGAGGFSLTAASDYHNHITYVDIDSKIKNIVVPQFLNEMQSDFVVDDARHYLQTTNNLYDAIIVDVYSDIKSMPAYLLTREYMQIIKLRLSASGVVIFNIIANPLLADAYSKRVDNTIRTVFHSCMTIPLAYEDRPTNILYACSNKGNQSDSVIYSDNLNNATTDSFNW